MGLSDSLPGSSRVRNLALAIMLVLGLIVSFSFAMASCGADGKGKTRALKEPEIQLLSRMRLNNFGDGSVAIKGKVGQGSRLTTIDGWVDWKRALIYISATNSGATALVQARPGTIAVRPGKPEPGSPPVSPPADGWRIRPLSFSGEDKAPLDNLIAFLFLMAHDQPDRTDLLKKLKTQWVRQDNANGIAVNVLLGPAVIPISEPAATPAPRPSPSASTSASPQPSLDPLSLEAHGGAVGYWLDENARLQRVEAFLGQNMPTTLDFTRGQPADFAAVDALGGREITPRAVTEAEATLISAMRQRDYRAKGAAVTVTLPVLPGALRQAKGWLDWQRGVVYLSVRDIDDASYNILLHATAKTVAIRQNGTADLPPVPAPKDKWEKAQWSDLSGTPELTDLDLLVFEVLSMGANKIDDAKRIKEGAKRLRVDVLNGVPVGVFELEQATAPGLARMRYWLDNSGVLRRLELRTATGGLAQLDLDLAAKLPTLPGTV